MSVHLRIATPDQSDALTALAFAAKAVWGYPRQQLDAWAESLRISPESISQQPTYVIEVENRVLAVAQLDIASDPWAIECLWVHPQAINQGFGKRLVREAIAYARAHGQARLAIDADPNAEPFYLHLGARRVGAIGAPIPGLPERVRPQLVLLTEAR